MDSVIGRLIYMITGDTDGLQKSLDKAKDKTGTLDDKFKSLQKTIAKGLSVVALVAFTKNTIEAASRAEELESKFNVVFEGMETTMKSWVQQYSDATNRGITATREFLATQQDLQTGYGATVKDASEFSKAVVGITNDLASFSNIPVEEAMASMNSGLNGQFEALRRIGVSLSVAQINQMAYSRSIGKTWEEMTALEKREAVLSGVVSQSKNALRQSITMWRDYDYTLGDAVATSDSFANTNQGMKQTFEDLKAEIGEQILPVATQFCSILLGMERYFNNLPDPVRKTAVALTALGVSMKLVSGPAGLALGAVGALTVLLSGNKGAADDLKEATDGLKSSMESYKDAVNTLNADTGTLTDSERQLYEARKNLYALEMAKKMDEVAKSYEKTEKNVAKLYAKEEQALAKFNAVAEVHRVLMEGDKEAAREYLKISQGSLDGLTGSALTYAETLGAYRNAFLDVLDGEDIGYWTGDVQTALEILRSNLSDASLASSKASYETEAALSTIAQAVRMGILDISSYETTSKDLYDRIMGMVAAMKEEEEAAKELGVTVSDTAKAAEDWRKVLREQSVDTLEDAGNYAEALEIRKQILDEERTAAVQELAIKAGLAKADEKFSDQRMVELERQLQDKKGWSEEYSALDAYYAQELENASARSAEKQAEILRKEEDAQKKSQETRLANREAFLGRLAIQDRKAWEDEAYRLDDNGDYEKAYDIRLALIDKEADAELDALKKKIDANEATEEELTNLRNYWDNERENLRSETDGKITRAAEEAARKQAETEKDLAHKRKQNALQVQQEYDNLVKVARNAQAQELEGMGKYEEAHAIKLALLQEEQQSERDALQEKIRANEATLDEMSKLEEKQALETQNLINDTNKKIVEGAEKARKELADSFRSMFSTFTGQLSSMLGALSSYQDQATKNQMDAIDARTQATLDSLGLAEETETESLRKEYEAAIAKGDMELAAEKQRAMDRLQIEQDADAKKKKLEREQAERSRKLAIFNATVSMLSAIIGFMADPGSYAGLALSAMAAATGAAQIAAITAEPLPAFDKGTARVTKDMVAQIHEGEAILPKPFAEGVRNGDITIGSGMQVVVNIQNYTTADVDVTGSESGDLREINIAIGKAVENGIGSGRYDNALLARFGLRRKGRNA